MKTRLTEIGIEETEWLATMIDELVHGRDMTDLIHELRVNGVDISMATFYRNFKPQNRIILPKNIPLAIRIVNILSRGPRINTSSSDVFPIMTALQEEGFVGVSLLELTLLCAFAEHSRQPEMTAASLGTTLQYLRNLFPVVDENRDEEEIRGTQSPQSLALSR